MKSVIGLALAALFLAAAPASAQTIDFRTAKCQDVVALPLDTLDLVAVWIDGNSADEQEDPESMVVDFSGTDAEDIQAYCQQHPATGLFQALDEMDKAAP